MGASCGMRGPRLVPFPLQLSQWLHACAGCASVCRFLLSCALGQS